MNQDGPDNPPGKDWQAVADREIPAQEVVNEPAAEAADTSPAPTDAPAYYSGPGMAQLETELDEAKALIEKLHADVLYAKSELQNTLRRADENVAKAHKFGVEKLLTEILPVADCLEQAINTPNPDLAVMQRGVSMTLDLINQALAKFGVTTADPQGAPFDPHQHEAMSIQETTEVPPNTVMAVFQKGYVLHGRVIRPARVVVSRAPKE